MFRLPSPLRTCGLAALALLLAPVLAGAADAQPAGDFRLQPGTGPRPQGPVDPDNPAAAEPQPPRLPTPAPTPSPLPTLAPAPAPAATATSTASPPASTTAAPPPRAAPARRTAPAALPAPTTTPATATAPLPAAPPAPAPTVSPAPDLPASAAPAAPGAIAWWWLVPAALAGAGAAWLLLARRRRPAGPGAAFVPPRAVPAATPPAPPEPVGPSPVSAPAPAPAAAPADPLELTLEPLRFSVTLVNAALQYRLTLTNRSDSPLGPLAIAADMIAAHASLTQDAQLARDGSALQLRHELAGLAPGETVELTGDLRLPLAEVTPIHAGVATLLVPLVRLRVEGAGPMHTVALVIGEHPASPGGRLRPFRIDLGPRIFATVGHRALAA